MDEDDRAASPQVRGVGKILPGLVMPFGLNACLTYCIVSKSAAVNIKKTTEAFRQSIALAWGDVQKSGPVDGGGIQIANREWDKNGNLVKKSAKGPYRVDVENLRGLNLRS